MIESACREIVPVIRDKIMSLGQNPDNNQVMEIIEDYVFSVYTELDINQLRNVIEHVFAKIRLRHGLLTRYINDDAINEIMVNGPDIFFYEDRDGIKHGPKLFDSKEELEEIIRNIAADVHREINELNPILDARLANGSRVNAVYGNIVSDGPVLTIRKFGRKPLQIEDLIKSGSISEEIAEYLGMLVRCRYNIFVSGGTSSGKTTFLGALSRFIPVDERVIIIEDSRELSMPHIDNLIQMECHNANSVGKGSVNMSQLIKTSLRMRPDRIIVGEVRGSEVADMLQAMNTGHDGSMSTGHGNSVNGMLRRLEAMYLMNSDMPIDAIRAQIIEGIDIMVHLQRMPDGTRKVLEISELIDFSEGKYVLNRLFIQDESGNIVPSGNKIINREKMIMRGQETAYGL